MRETLSMWGEARYFQAGDVVCITGTSNPANASTSIVVRIVDEDTIETMPATWRRRLAAWVWREWGRR